MCWGRFARLVRSDLIGVEQLLLQFVLKLCQGGNHGIVDQILVQGVPEPFHLAVDLGPVGSTDAFHPQLQSHAWKRMRGFRAQGRVLGPLVA